MTDGVDVYADYATNIFRMAHPEEYKGELGIGLQSFENFGTLGTMMNSSTGEGVTTAINNLWNLMFSSYRYGLPRIASSATSVLTSVLTQPSVRSC